MIHDFEGELYVYDFEGETAAADDDSWKRLVADRRCCSKHGDRGSRSRKLMSREMS